VVPITSAEAALAPKPNRKKPHRWGQHPEPDGLAAAMQFRERAAAVEDVASAEPAG
jgi:hypothetical protein